MRGYCREMNFAGGFARWLLSAVAFFLVAAVAGLGAVAEPDYRVTIDGNTPGEAVSRELMGFNIIYCFERDEGWKSGQGKVPDLLAELNTAILRYPGGTVNTFYHWKNPTGQGWVDSWSDAYDPGKNLPGSATMSLDEYLDLVRLRGLTPLIGVNLSSGLRFPKRQAEAYDEALEMVRHCVARGVKGAYYYLDNEHYRPDANHPSTPEVYGDAFNRYAQGIRVIDPAAKCIANLHSGANANGYDWVRRAVRRAGASIDFVDVHFYWRHNITSFAAWTEEPHMTHQRGRPYREQRALYRKIFAEEGFPDIDLISLEWNISASGKNPQPTQSEAALMVSEQFIQFIQSGMKIACYWPLSMPGKNFRWQYRCLLNSGQDYAPNKVHGMFRQFAEIGGQRPLASQVVGKADPEWLTHLALRAADGRSLTVYLINKNPTQSLTQVALDLPDLGEGAKVTAVGFEAADNSGESLSVRPVAVSRRGPQAWLVMPRNSFAKVVVTK